MGSGLCGRGFDVMFCSYGMDEEIGDEAHDQQAHHEVEDGVVRLLRRHGFFVGDGKSVHHLRPDDGRHGPGGDEAPVDGADLIAAKEVTQIRGNGGKATPVHGEDQTCGDDKQGDAATPLSPGHAYVQRDTEDEVDAVDAFATGEI